jgi:ATP-binding cassette subfamily B protein
MEKKSKPKFDKNTFKRLFSYIFKYYKWRFFFVVFLVLVSALTGVASSLFIQRLIDDYITPMVGVKSPNFAPLLKALLIMIVIYLIGIIANYVYQRMMSRIAQRNLKSYKR